MLKQDNIALKKRATDLGSKIDQNIGRIKVNIIEYS